MYSPNLVWLSIAAAIYVLFPYDFEAARTFAPGWVASRLLLNLALMFGYVGFWHGALYRLHWSKRKYAANLPSSSR